MLGHDPTPQEMEAHAARLAESLLDAFAVAGPGGLSAVRDRWREMAAGLPTLKLQHKAKLVLRMALERIANP